MSILTKATYATLVGIVGDAIDHERCEVREFGVVVGWPVGVYLLGHRHAGGSHFDVDYVGSAVRPAGDMADRICDHLRDETKFYIVTGQVILPLRAETPDEDVRDLEGRVARALGVPHLTLRVPGGRRRRSAARTSTGPPVA